MVKSEPNLFATPRRAPRYYFGGAAEFTNESGHMAVAMVRTLSLYGCFIKTARPFQIGAKIKLRITDAGAQFSATARIANQAADGIGVEFTEISAADRAQPENCLSELAERNEVPDAKRLGGAEVFERLSRGGKD